mgnify:CR=1 FL=1
MARLVWFDLIWFGLVWFGLIQVIVQIAQLVHYATVRIAQRVKVRFRLFFGLEVGLG